MKNYKEQMGIIDIHKRGLSIDLDNIQKKTIDSHADEPSPEIETEDTRKKWLTHLSYDPRSLAEQEGTIDPG